MTIQQVIESLLRSRLYRTIVAIETSGGETHEGHVQEVRYDGSRSSVVLTPPAAGAPVAIPLAEIARVAPGGEDDIWALPTTSGRKKA